MGVKKLVLVAVRYCQFCVAGPGLGVCWGASALGFLSLILVAKLWSLEKLGKMALWGSESSGREGSGSRLSLWRKPESIQISSKAWVCLHYKYRECFSHSLPCTMC